MSTPYTETRIRVQPKSHVPLFSTPVPRATLCVVTTAALLWLAYFPVAWGWIGWVALVPLLALVRMELTTRKLLLASWLCGLLFFFPILQWIRVADYRMYATWIALALYCSLFVPAGIWLVRRLDRGTRLPFVLIVPAVWTGLEYVRAHALTGFAWYFLGHTQHDVLPVIQIADVGGAYAVTFLVAAVNALVFEWVYQWSDCRRFLRLADPLPRLRLRATMLSTAFVLFALGGTLAYGVWRTGQSDFSVGPRLALLQGSLDQRIKNDATQPDGDKAARDMVQHYAELCSKAAALKPRPDLIVWPETAWPGQWTESPSGHPNADCRQLMEWLWQRWPLPHLIGMNSSIDDGPKHRLHNSAVLFAGRDKLGGRYDKMHRVPFGEYVPFRDWFPWMDRFSPYDFDYSIQSGKELWRFPLHGSHFGVLICYEDTDPYLARQYVREEPKADFLVNISNDGWFDGSAEHEEHLAICRFRAVECRRAVARAVNMGVSAIVDGNGRVLAPHNDGRKHGGTWEVEWENGKARSFPLSQWRRLKKEEAVLIGNIPIDRRDSLYAAYGDWLPQGCWAVLGLGLLWSLTSRRLNADGAGREHNHR